MSNLAEGVIENGIKKGVRQGIKTGRVIGERECRLEIARRMVRKGYRDEEIAEISGANVEEIEKIRREEP